MMLAMELIPRPEVGDELRFGGTQQQGKGRTRIKQRSHNGTHCRPFWEK